MPHKLKQLSGKKVVSIFEEFGYKIQNQRGSHIKMKRKNSRIILVPNHKIINKGTLKAIYNQALIIIPETKLRKYFYTQDK